jgi:uncharacterized protein (DUF305 family)
VERNVANTTWIIVNSAQKLASFALLRAARWRNFLTNNDRNPTMKHFTFHTTRAACLAATSVFLFAAAVQAQPSPMPGMSPEMHKSMMGSDGMKRTMSAGMESMQKMPLSGDTDKDFAMMMKMHHQQGVDMAEMQIAHGKSSEMKKMAKNIVAAQNKEIRQFDAWLAKQK